MEAVNEKKKVHQGTNVRLARTWKKVTQSDLADRISVYQSEMSKLEGQEEIDNHLLDKIAKALNVPVDFFKEFEPEKAVNIFNQYDSKIEINSAENSKDAVLQQGEQNITNYNYPIDDIKDLFNRLLQEKDKQIDRFEKQVIDLQKQIEELKAKL